MKMKNVERITNT